MANYPDVATAKAAVEAHPVCDSLLVTPANLVVFYPPAYVIPGGVTVQRGLDDLAAYNFLYDQLDRFWNAQRLQVAAQ